jgi:magnesium transporter
VPEWIDLLDPTLDELRAHAPAEIEETALELLLREPVHEDEPRPTMQSHGSYCFGVLLLAVAAPDDDSVFYQEVDLVVTPEILLTVRKTPPHGRPPYDPEHLMPTVSSCSVAGMIAYRLIDDIAERYLDLVDDLDAEIDELEDRLEDLPPAQTRERISDIRHDLLKVRRTLAPMRDVVHRIVDGVVDVDNGTEVFPRDVEIAFNTAYDKLLRALDGLEISRDLLAGVRDYHQAQIAIEQNEVAKRLTAIASILLVPTFIVGLYGQNFVDIPELRWHFGYAFSWGLIVVTTVLQVWWFRKKDWL